jgi:serine O-acetyltransferase
MLSYLAEDLRAFTRHGGLSARIKCVLISHTYHLVVLYRTGQTLARIPLLGVVFRVLFEYAIRVLYASDISLRSTIGPGLMVVHGHDIVIGGDVHMGRGCKILNGVTLGNRDTESPVNQQPVVGDNVVIGSGAKILGAIRIGDGVVIGANSVVLQNFPSGVVVAGIPARVIRNVDGARP